MPRKIEKLLILDSIGDRLKDQQPRAHYSHLDDDDRLLILWGLYRGWSIRKTAETLPTSQSTVKNFRAKLFQDPAIVFEIPVLKLTEPKSYQCSLCGETRPTRMKGMRHVLAHVLPYEVARDVPLDDCPKPL